MVATVARRRQGARTAVDSRGGPQLVIRTLAFGALLAAFLSTAIAGASIGATANASATSRGLVVAGARFFPVMLIDQCTASDMAKGRTLGINLVVNESCPGVAPGAQLSLLRGNGLAVLPIGARATRGAGLVGWTYPDEPDNNGWTPASLAKTHPYRRGNKDGLVTFVTTTGRFFRLDTGPAGPVRRLRAARRHGRVRPVSAECLPGGSHLRLQRAAGVRQAGGLDADLPVDRDRPDPARRTAAGSR